MSDSWYDYDEFLQPHHLKGKAATLEITGVGEMEINDHGKKSVKPILRFKGTRKYMFVNKTNRKVLCELFGDQKTACVGKHITLAPVRLDNGKDSIVLRAATDKSATTPNGASAIAKTAMEQLWALTKAEEDQQGVIDRTLAEHHGDVEAALQALKQKYAVVTS